MPTTVGIITFLSMINSMLCLVEHEKSFITLGIIVLNIGLKSNFMMHFFQIRSLNFIIILQDFSKSA